MSAAAIGVLKKEIRKEKEIVVALAGNPNSGKTSLFNELTGARQHVGNWPGVTVEKKEGFLVHEGQKIRVVDLPGTYSLGAYSEDEVIARNFIIKGTPDVVVNVVDASNLERNLYLTVQLLEMGANVVVALNMFDEAQAKNIEIDVRKLSQLLGVPVVPTVAIRGQGVRELLASVLQVSQKKEPSYLRINYGQEVEEEIAKIEAIIKKKSLVPRGYSPRWVAIKLLENDELILKESRSRSIREVIAQIDKSKKRIFEILGDDPESIIADRRYGFTYGLVRETVTKRSTTEERLSLSDKIDLVVTNRYLGIPIFFFALWAVFQFTFTVGNPLIEYIEAFFEWLGGVVSALIADKMLASLVVDGIIGGVGSVLSFIPPIFLLFLAISFLEDSGYMARAAYIMDKVMHTLGLHGKSFIPLLVGFGCNVPAVMATRTLENKKDRIITILIVPLMSCTARLPVYVLFVSAFFKQHQGLVIFSLYLMGIALAILMGMLFKNLFFKKEDAPFVMELPPYRLPTLKGTLIHMWERGYSFIRKAGTVILAASVIIWFLSHIPLGVPLEESVIGRLGQLLAPIYTPCGFGTWEAAVALFFGILAKEAVVGTLGVVYSVGEEGLATAIQQHFTPLSAYSFMAMTLLYIPCVAVIGAIKRETDWKWTSFAIAYTLALGWVVAFLIFQIGRLIGLS